MNKLIDALEGEYINNRFTEHYCKYSHYKSSVDDLIKESICCMIAKAYMTTGEGDVYNLLIACHIINDNYLFAYKLAKGMTLTYIGVAPTLPIYKRFYKGLAISIGRFMKLNSKESTGHLDQIRKELAKSYIQTLFLYKS